MKLSVLSRYASIIDSSQTRDFGGFVDFMQCLVASEQAKENAPCHTNTTAEDDTLLYRDDSER